jgi:glycolate oxidase
VKTAEISNIADTAALAERLREFIGERYVVSATESKRPFECDGLSVYKQMPGLVVLPSSTEQVQKTLRLCSQHRIPVVVRGAGTGLSGGALPHRDGVLLSLTRLSRILEIDPDAGLARVQPGVTNLAISEACAPHGLFYAPDPSSQIACSIGGNVAENAGGVHCLKYGLTVHNVVQLTVVTIDGEIITVGCEGLAGAGPDMLALMIGSEGMLGVVTEVTVKLTPVPSHCQVILASFNQLEHAGDAVSAVIAEGIIPAGFEMMDSHAIQAAEDFVGAGYDTNAAALLLCELDGTEEEVRHCIEQVTAVFRQHNARSIRVSQNEAERLLDISRLSKDYGLRVANVFHAGDGNLHPLILFDESQPGELQKAEAFGAEILRICVDAGGCITGEHGVGVEKLEQMLDQFSDAELAQLNAIKDALDPDALLNPGKGVPTLKRCQEYRST